MFSTSTSTTTHFIQYFYFLFFTEYGLSQLECGPLSHSLCLPGCGYWQQSAAKRDWEWRTSRPGRTYRTFLVLDDDRSSGTRHFIDFSSTFRDLLRIVQTETDKLFFSRKIWRCARRQQWKTFCDNSCCSCRKEIQMLYGSNTLFVKKSLKLLPSYSVHIINIF